MKQRSISFPPLPSNIGKRGKSLMPPNGDVLHYTIVDEVRQFQDRSKSKVIVLQLIKFEDRRHEIRVGYYIIGKKPRMLGRWVWGQYAAFMPVGVFRRVVQK